jgi:hypothetical protein
MRPGVHKGCTPERRRNTCRKLEAREAFLRYFSADCHQRGRTTKGKLAIAATLDQAKLRSEPHNPTVYAFISDQQIASKAQNPHALAFAPQQFK